MPPPHQPTPKGPHVPCKSRGQLPSWHDINPQQARCGNWANDPILILLPQSKVSFPPPKVVFLKSCTQNANWNHVSFHDSWVSMSFFLVNGPFLSAMVQDRIQAAGDLPTSKTSHVSESSPGEGGGHVSRVSPWFLDHTSFFDVYILYVNRYIMPYYAYKFLICTCVSACQGVCLL